MFNPVTVALQNTVALQKKSLEPQPGYPRTSAWTQSLPWTESRHDGPWFLMVFVGILTAKTCRFTGIEISKLAQFTARSEVYEIYTGCPFTNVVVNKET